MSHARKGRRMSTVRQHLHRRPFATGPRLGRLVAALAVVALTVAGLFAGTASAHSTLVSSDPADGARLDSMPQQVGLIFNEDVDPSLSQVVVNSGGVAREAQNVVADGPRVSATMPADVDPGQVSVLYKIVSADGHPVSGRISFTVDGGGATATAAPTGAPTTATPARPATQETDSGNGMMIALTVVAAIVLVVIGALVLRSERRRR